MLDLHPGVHLDEIEFAILVEEFEGAGAAVADAATGLGAAFADPLALLHRDPRGGGLLDHLLVAALHGAVAFPQMDGVALGVSEQLELDVAGILQVFLHVNHGIAKGGHGLGAGQGDGIDQGSLGVDDPHAAPTAPARGLNDDRVADLAGQLEGALLVLVQGPSEPGTQGTPAVCMARMAETLSPMRRMVSGRGPTKMKPLFSTRSAKSAFSDRKP
jgi:hypothetical protein